MKQFFIIILKSITCVHSAYTHLYKLLYYSNGKSMAEKTYTIKDVANIAGVSPAAVSRYMNDGSLSEEKREKIREAIRKTGYRPNLMAQSMRTGKGGQIGLIVPKIHSDSVSQIMAGISDTLTERNYLTMLGSTEGSRDMELRYLENMQNSQVAGIILMGVTMTPSLSDAIRNSSVPVVITGQNFAGLPCVYHNDSGAMEELTRRIIRKGRKHVVYIGVSTKDIAAGLNRQNGVLRAWKEAGLPEEDLQLAEVGFDAAEAKECMARMLKNRNFDGVLCATDAIALGAMKAIHEAGLRIPDDISIAGLGDSWAGTFVDPPLTTAHLYYRQCGREAAAMLLRLIDDNGRSLTVSQTMLEYTIVDRESM